jgi:hypothetical protein
MSTGNNNLENIIGNFFNNKDVQNTLKDLTSQMSSYLINCNILNTILESNPNITDELITEQINLLKKAHPNSTGIINKYLQSYEDKSVYQIRKFLKSGDCKKALDDSQVQKYLNEILNSPQFKEKFQQLIHKHLFSSQ